MLKIKEDKAKQLIWWFRQMNNIDMSPVFQRKNEIWKEYEQQYLIDSILNDFDIPKFYISDNSSYGMSPLTTKKKLYSVIDGKQRLEAIFSFFNNKFSLAKGFEYFADPKLKLGGLNYSQLKTLHPTIAQKIEDYELTVMKVTTDDTEKINQLFIRLNKTSYALSGAEKRNAEKGLIVRIIRLLARHKFFKKHVRFTQTRMQEHNACAKMLLVELNDDLVDMKKKNLDILVTTYFGITGRSGRDLYRHARKMLDKMTEVFKERDPLLNSQGPLILYYWFIKHNKKDSNEILRNFLRGFIEALNKNDERVKNNLPGVDELSNYKLFSRSPNDQKSLSLCYEILTKRYEAFKAK